MCFGDFRKSSAVLIFANLNWGQHSFKYKRLGWYLTVLLHLWSICITFEGIITFAVKFYYIGGLYNICGQLLRLWLQQVLQLTRQRMFSKANYCGLLHIVWQIVVPSITGNANDGIENFTNLKKKIIESLNFSIGSTSPLLCLSYQAELDRSKLWVGGWSSLILIVIPLNKLNITLSGNSLGYFKHFNLIHQELILCFIFCITNATRYRVPSWLPPPPPELTGNSMGHL